MSSMVSVCGTSDWVSRTCGLSPDSSSVRSTFTPRATDVEAFEPRRARLAAKLDESLHTEAPGVTSAPADGGAAHPAKRVEAAVEELRVAAFDRVRGEFRDDIR